MAVGLRGRERSAPPHRTSSAGPALSRSAPARRIRTAQTALRVLLPTLVRHPRCPSAHLSAQPPSSSGMAGTQAAPADWSRLPPELLEQCCAWIESEVDRRAALQTCAAWARAVLHAPRGPHLSLGLEREAPFAPSARALERLWGPTSQAAAPQQEQQQQAGGSKGAKLVLHDGNPQRFLAELRAAGVRLACVTDLEMQDLTVDALVPPSLHVALPNLRSLKLRRCVLPPTAATAQLDSECSSLQHLEVSLGAQAASLPAQLAQLPSLRGLTSLTLHHSPSTAFLPSLSQLTALELGSLFRGHDEDTQRPTADWTATLRHVAQCTRLQSLALPAATAEELRPVATALPQLQHLHLNYDFREERDEEEEVELDGDAMAEVLLGLTQLTSLRWDEATPYVMRRSHTDRPCSWRELTFCSVGVQQLLHLPLRSLTSPVTVWTLDVAARHGVADVQRLVGVLVGEGGPGVRWLWSACSVRFSNWCSNPGVFEHGATPADTPAALLRALQPLLAGAPEVCVDNVKWDAEAVRALPQCCRRLSVVEGEVSLVAMVEVARRLRHLESVELKWLAVEPWAVVGYLVAEEGERRQAGEEQGRRVRVRVHQPRSEAADHWEQARDAVQALGLAWLDLVVQE